MHPPLASSDRPLYGMALANLAVLIFTIMDCLVKLASETYPTGQIVFFRNLCAFFPVLLFIGRSGGWRMLRTQRPWAHLVRGCIGVSAMASFFLSYKLLPLPDAIAIGLSAPIFLAILSVPLLGEKVGLRRTIAIIVGFLGVVTMSLGPDAFQWGALVAVISAILYALALIAIRRLGKSEPALVIVFYFTLFAMIASAVSLPWQWVQPDAKGLGLLIVIGIMGGCGQIIVTTAIKNAPVTLIAPFDYMSLVYGLGLGYLIWGTRPSIALLLGAILVIGSGLYILWRETRQHKKAALLPVPEDLLRQ